jgi:hypothetical protein
MKTRIGKIARLPRTVRDPLNQRLQDGEPGKRLVDWLNSLPETQAVLQTEFGGRPVSEQNLSEWKQGGYRDWQRQQEACDLVRHLVEQTNDLGNASGGVAVSARLSALVTVELAQAARTLVDEAGDPQERWARLQEIVGKLAQLRREESNAGQLELKRERWEAEQKAAEERKESNIVLFPLRAFTLHQLFYRVVADSSPGAQAAAMQCLDRLLPRKPSGSSNLGQAAAHPAPPIKAVQGNSRPAAAPDQTESNPVKPNPTG